MAVPVISAAASRSPSSEDLSSAKRRPAAKPTTSKPVPKRK